ncbi:MAG: response regulator [Elusimicrobia bacterium]|nr:response regulator [Candidatus Liberimonas magnetica]
MTDNAIFHQNIPKILIVDDTPANLELLFAMLDERRYKIRAAVSGKIALEAAHNDAPDLILLDINMPEMNGYEVCRCLKEDEKLKDIPVIFLSALSEQEDKVKAFAAGGVDYITKPFHSEEVRARVETHLTLKATREFLKDKNQFLEYTFSRFVSPKVVETMKKRNISEFLKMERREITVLFGDLRGFTTLANEVTPEDIQETLNSFLEVMVAGVEKADGMIDKFLGDGFMALFGAPFRQDDHALRALEASVAIQLAHLRWMEERSSLGRPFRPLGLGVATGETVIGAYGTSNRMDYTALGHAVNLASRLCSVAKAGEILTLAETIEKAGLKNNNQEGFPFAAVTKGKLSFKNIPIPVEVFSISKKVVLKSSAVL